MNTELMDASLGNLKLDYFELLSPEPIYIPHIGSILSPTLKDIASISMNTYRYYLAVLLAEPRDYSMLIGQNIEKEALPDKETLHIFDMICGNEDAAIPLLAALNFFMKEEVSYSAQHKCLLVQEEEKIIGIITKELYSQVCNLIFQRNCIRSTIEEDPSKVKSKKALEIMEKLKIGRAKKSKKNQSDKNMELGNIISAVASKSPSLNILNIWDLTVYQLWDCFTRLNHNNVYDIQSMSVAAWGNKDNHFDAAGWFKRIDEEQ